MLLVGMAIVLGTAVIGWLPGASAEAKQLPGDQVRVSQQGPDRNSQWEAGQPDVAYSPAANQYLVVWSGDATVTGSSSLDRAKEKEIYARLLAADGSPVGAPIQVSEVGPDGATGWFAGTPRVVHNPVDNEYLVMWRGNERTSEQTDEQELYVQRLSASGALVGEATRVTQIGPPGARGYSPGGYSLAHNSVDNEYLVGWTGLRFEEEAFFDVGLSLQRVGPSGALIAEPQRIVEPLPGNPTTPFGELSQPRLVHNPTANEYLLAWVAPRAAGPGRAQRELIARRLSADAVPVGPATVVSETDSRGGAAPFSPAVAYNATANQYIAVWSSAGGPGVLVDEAGDLSREIEVFAQRLDAGVREIGTDIRVSSMGRDGDSKSGAFDPAVAYDSTDNEYLVVWRGTGGSALANGESEVFGQRLDAAGAELGGDFRVSVMGPNRSASFRIDYPEIAYNAAADDYLVAWGGNDSNPFVADLELEIYARRVKPPTAAACVRLPAVPAQSAGSDDSLTLTPGQLRINQRIGQAAIRRATAIEKWLNAGIVNRDLCGGGLARAQLHKGVETAPGRGSAPGRARPRGLIVARGTSKPNVNFEVTSEQLQINQRVYAAAVRRANALAKRIGGGLTGGDVKDGQLTPDRLQRDLTLGAVNPPTSPPRASRTEVEPAGAASTANLTPTIEQLRINQKIAQAAVRRTNTLRRTLATGLTGDNFADGSITAADFAP